MSAPLRCDCIFLRKIHYKAHSGHCAGNGQYAVADTGGGSPVLAADEPTGNLDTDHEAAIMEIFRRLAHETGKCIIVVTHSQKAAAYADETFLLQEGSLIVEK